MNNVQNFADSLGRNSRNILGAFEQISVERQQIELRSLLSEQEKQYKALLVEAQNNPGNYENIMADFDLMQQEIISDGKGKIKGGWASKVYDQQSYGLANQYQSQANSLYQGLATQDAKNKAINLFDDSVNNVGFDKASYEKSWGEFKAVLGQSALWTDGEKERMTNDYERKFLGQAVKAGYQSVFAQTEGDYTAKARAAEQYVLNQDLGKLTADETSNMLSSIKALENQEYTREMREQQASDDKLDQEFWQYAKNGDLVGLTEAFGKKKFFDPDRNKYWWSFLQSLTDKPDKDSTAKAEREWAENYAAEIRWKRENGEINQDDARNMAEVLHSTYGGNPNMSPVTRDLMDWSRDPKLSDNPAYSFGTQYMESTLKEMKLDDQPALKAVIQDALQKHAHSEGSDFLQTEQEYRKLVDSLVMEPMIKKMNDTIKHQWVGDEYSINSSEEMTKAFQNGNFQALLEVDENGNINSEEYRKWLNAWGIRGKEENIDQFLKDYIDDFGTAARRDFGANAMMHVDRNTRRPIVEAGGEKYVLHLVDGEEKERLKKLGIKGVAENDEAWYKWNQEKGEYEYFQGVGR